MKKRNKVLYFYEKYDKELKKYAKSVLKNVDGKNYSSNAGDVVQNAYASILMYFPKEIKSERAYVFQVLKNEIFRLKKESKLDVELIDNTEEFADEEEFINNFFIQEKIVKIEQKYMPTIQADLRHSHMRKLQPKYKSMYFCLSGRM